METKFGDIVITVWSTISLFAVYPKTFAAKSATCLIGLMCRVLLSNASNASGDAFKIIEFSGCEFVPANVPMAIVLAPWLFEPAL